MLNCLISKSHVKLLIFFIFLFIFLNPTHERIKIYNMHFILCSTNHSLSHVLSFTHEVE
jgi:hypothetical protein